MIYGLTIFVLLAIYLALALLRRSKITRHGKRLPRPPGTHFLLGNGIQFLKPREELLNWFSNCERQIGLHPFEISVPTLPPGIVINDPSDVEHVLKHENIFIKGAFFRSRSWDLFGNGIINADGDLWKLQRKAGLPFFSNANLKVFVNEVLPPYLKDTEKRLEEAASSSDPVDMQDVFLELTTRLMGKMAYNMDIPASLPFSKAFDFASGAITQRFQNPFWKLSELMRGAQLRASIAEVKKFGRTIVSSALARRKGIPVPLKGPGATIEPIRNNLVDALLDHISDQQVVADAAMNYLSAGRDTTAQSLTWTLYRLIRHPACLQKLLTELGKTFPKKGPHLPLTFNSLQPNYLPFANAVFNESLRLHPPVPIEMKECIAPNIFPDGTCLPRGALVMWIPWVMGRSKQIWGHDADDFRPERWISPPQNKNGTKVISKSTFEFPVFNGGARSCLGRKMAELLAVCVITNLISKYEFEEVWDEKLGGCGWGNDRLSQTSLTLPMEGGLPCTVRVRRNPYAREPVDLKLDTKPKAQSSQICLGGSAMKPRNPEYDSERGSSLSQLFLAEEAREPLDLEFDSELNSALFGASSAGPTGWDLSRM